MSLRQPCYLDHYPKDGDYYLFHYGSGESKFYEPISIERAISIMAKYPENIFPMKLEMTTGSEPPYLRSTVIIL